MAWGFVPEQPSTGAFPACRGGYKGLWRSRWLIAGYIIAILVLSVTLAYASAPDPSWIPGIYDDHDGDDMVGMVTDATGASDSQATQRVERVLAGFVPGTATGRAANPTARRRTIRGPPVGALHASSDLSAEISRHALGDDLPLA